MHLTQFKVEPPSYYVNFWTQYNLTFSFFAFVQQILWQGSGATNHCWVHNQMRCILADTTQQLRHPLSNIVLRMIQTWEQLWGDVWCGKIKNTDERNYLYIGIPETLDSTEPWKWLRCIWNSLNTFPTPRDAKGGQNMCLSALCLTFHPSIK